MALGRRARRTASMRRARTAAARKTAASTVKTATKASRRRAEQAAAEVDPRRSGKAADGEGDRLRRAPDPHANALAPGPPSAGKAIIEPIAATAKTPLATPSANTVGLSGQPGRSPRPARAGRAPPPSRRTRRPSSRAASPCTPGAADRLMAAADADEDHAEQARRRAAERREAGRLAGGEAEQQPGDRLEDQFLRAIGEHRHRDEDGEAARARIGGDLAQRRGERDARGAVGAAEAPTLDPGDGGEGDDEGDRQADAADDGQQAPRGEKGSSSGPRRRSSRRSRRSS